MARRSDPFNPDDWLTALDGSHTPKYKEVDLDWLIRQYPQLESELRAMDARGQEFTPVTVAGLNPNKPLTVVERTIQIEAQVQTQSDADIQLPGGFKFKFKDIDWKLIVLVTVILSFFTVWMWMKS